MHADSSKAARDDVLRLGGAAAVSFEDFGDRLRQWRLRIARDKRARNRVRWPLCAKSGAFRNGYDLPTRADGTGTRLQVAWGRATAYILLAFQSSLMT